MYLSPTYPPPPISSEKTSHPAFPLFCLQAPVLKTHRRAGKCVKMVKGLEVIHCPVSPPPRRRPLSRHHAVEIPGTRFCLFCPSPLLRPWKGGSYAANSPPPSSQHGLAFGGGGGDGAARPRSQHLRRRRRRRRRRMAERGLPYPAVPLSPPRRRAC